MTFDHITVSEGLTQGVVTTIYRDSRDFMWFGTLNGLNRYDGINIKKFESLTDDSTSLTHGNIRVIIEDKEKNLWVGTIYGLNMYSYRNEKFTRIVRDNTKQNSLPGNFIVNISEDSEKNLWIVTENGVSVYSSPEEGFRNYYLPADKSRTTDYIEASCTHNSDTIYLFANERILQFLTRDSTYTVVVPQIETKEVNTLYVDRDHTIWLGTENDGAYTVDKRGKITHFYPGGIPGEGPQSISIKSILPDSKGYLWFSTRGGLFRYDQAKKIYIKYANDFNNPKSLLSSYARTYYEDEQGIIWIGTVGGVNKSDPSRQRFSHYKTNITSGGSPAGSLYSNDNIIWSFARDQKDNLWVGSMRTLLSCIPFDRLSKSEFQTAEFYKNGVRISPPFNSVLELKTDNKNNLWMGTDNGLYYYNTRTRELKSYMHDPDNENSLCNNTVSAITHEGDSVIWLGTSGGVSRFAHTKDIFTNFYNDPSDNSSIAGNIIYSIVLEDKKILWITSTGGISRTELSFPGSLYPGQVRFSNLQNRPAGMKTFETVNCFIKTSRGDYWIGTDNGIFRIDSTPALKEHLSVAEGLPNRFVYQMLEDSKGQLWISTENGLSCFNPATRVFRNFNIGDGLQANEFNSNSSMKDKDGFLYFGGINGFNMFHPDSLVISEYSPNVVLTGMELYNQPVEIDKPANGFTLRESISSIKEIKLDYRQNFFTFSFASLDYKNPERIHYEYKLEGVDDEWVYSKNTAFAHYTDVKPGKYTFSVRATNSDGIWSNNTAQLKIIITPPFWRTTVFYITIFLLFILLTYLLYKYRVKTLEKEKSMLEEQIQRRTQEINKVNQDLRKSNSFIESVINNATYGITVIDLEGDIILANPAASQLTGYTQEELLKMNFRNLTPAQWHKLDDEILEALKKGNNSYHEKEYIKKDGTIFHVAISSSFIKNYDIPAIVNIINDVTERVANEKELREHRTNLEALVSERTTDLIAAKERAEKADRLKSAFLSNISHEVRTPMNSIMGFSNLLKTQSCETDQVNEYLEFINSGAHNLLNIVTNIVEISKISADDITISPNKFNFTKFVNNISSDFYDKTKEKGLEFTLDYGSDCKDLWIVSDESKLSASINHLLDNALKFTSKGYIRLGFRLESDMIRVSIEDSGIGISPDMISDIFEPFKQADISLSRAYGGTGLGLTISKAYIEKMGGRIWVDSVQGKGSSFYFSFPLVRYQEKPVADHKTVVPGRYFSILIVEDEDMNYFYLAEILKNKAGSIYHARDGYTAIEQCRNNPGIDMVLMDIKLPGINGLEATMEIKKFRPDLPIIAQTAYTLVGDREKALVAGCNDYISKPINREKLYSILNNYLKY